MKIIDLISQKNIKVLCGSLDVDIKNIEIDSRKVAEGTLFVCIDGLNSDGHDYIQNAIDNGAVAVVVSKDGDYSSFGKTFLLAENTREALSLLASELNRNPSESFSLIGVTGTNGKTSTTYFIEQLLRVLGRKTGVIGTTGALINGEGIDFSFDTSTTPDAHHLQQIFAIMRDEGTENVVMEVTSQGLHQKRTFGTNFDVAVFTNLTQDHLDYHGTMEEYFNAKLELFKSSKSAVLNIDGDYVAKVIDYVDDYFTIAIDKEADLQATNIIYSGAYSKFTLLYKGNKYDTQINVPGKFTVYNLLCAIGSLIKCNIDIEDILNAIPNIKGVRGRIESVENDLGVSILVDYAHSPDGLTNIINSVREFTKGKVITVFGCGGDRDRTKRPIMASIASELSDIVVATSDNPRTEDPLFILSEVSVGLNKDKEHYIIMDRREAILKAISIAEKDDSVIIAGKGHEDYQIIGTDKIHFDDVEECAKAIAKLKA